MTATRVSVYRCNYAFHLLLQTQRIVPKNLSKSDVSQKTQEFMGKVTLDLTKSQESLYVT